MTGQDEKEWGVMACSWDSVTHFRRIGFYRTFELKRVDTVTYSELFKDFKCSSTHVHKLVMLCRGVAVRGYRHVGAEFHAGKAILAVRQESVDLRRRVCASQEVVRRAAYPRRFRSTPIGPMRCWWRRMFPGGGCLTCGAVRQAPVRVVDGWRAYTRTFERHVLQLSRHMTYPGHGVLSAGGLGRGQRYPKDNRSRSKEQKHMPFLAVAAEQGAQNTHE